MSHVDSVPTPEEGEAREPVIEAHFDDDVYRRLDSFATYPMLPLSVADVNQLRSDVYAMLQEFDAQAGQIRALTSTKRLDIAQFALAIAPKIRLREISDALFAQGFTVDMTDESAVPTVRDEGGPERIAAIRARLAARTLGKWSHVTSMAFFGFVASCGDSDDEKHYVVPEGAHAFRTNGAKHDAEFIANAPSDLAYLLDENARLRVEGERLRDQLSESFEDPEYADVHEEIMRESEEETDVR